MSTRLKTNSGEEDQSARRKDSKDFVLKFVDAQDNDTLYGALLWRAEFD